VRQSGSGNEERESERGKEELDKFFTTKFAWEISSAVDRKRFRFALFIDL